MPEDFGLMFAFGVIGVFVVLIVAEALGVFDE